MTSLHSEYVSTDYKNDILKGTVEGNPLWRIAGYTYKAAISGLVTKFPQKGGNRICPFFIRIHL